MTGSMIAILPRLSASKLKRAAKRLTTLTSQRSERFPMLSVRRSSRMKGKSAMAPNAVMQKSAFQVPMSLVVR